MNEETNDIFKINEFSFKIKKQEVRSVVSLEHDIMVEFKLGPELIIMGTENDERFPAFRL